MGTEGFGPRVVFNLPGGIPVSETVTVTWFIMAVLIIFAYIATRKSSKIPKGLQNFTEILVDGINGLTKSTMGEHNKNFAPYIGTLLLFIGIGNIIGLFGMRPPTADVNTTMGLSIMTFCMIQGFGVRSKGVGGHLKGFLDPMPLLLPINILGELATPISLGFRLFGNVVGGLIIMSLLYSALGGLSAKLGIMIPVLQMGVPAALHIYFDLFAGLLQSFIFAMLTMVNVSMAMD
ncbi:MAG: F0F1 ATP synthase subunit A [Firmicutes bacterium]|nr:F0F1 ATP synthase subunit A [Bacillota bacterium]